MMRNVSGFFLGVFILLYPLPAFPQASGPGALNACIVMYEDGKYAEAQDSLKALLPRLKSEAEVAECYKYIAFTAVMLDMIEAAKKNFQEALLKYPEMTLDTVSVSPNIVVVFNQVKTEREIKKGHTMAWVASGAAGLVLAAVSGYFFYAGGDAYQKYDASEKPDEIVSFREETKKDYLIGQIALCTAGASLGFSLYKFLTRPKEK